MSKLTDPAYLRGEHYKDASNLDARIQLHARFSTNRQGWMPWVFEQLKLAAESRVLELGCGPGDLWRDNAPRVPAGWEVTLSDLSLGMLQEARRNLDGGHRFASAVVDARAIPFAGGRFDAVIANHMLYHIPDRDRALAEIRRVLVPGGRLYASTVGPDHMRELRELIQSFDPRIPWGNWDTMVMEFDLENGGAQLARWFARVARRRYPDDLVITEAAPLVAYVLSTVDAGTVLQGENLAAFTRFVEERLAREGTVRVTKDSGLFEAWRDDGI